MKKLGFGLMRLPIIDNKNDQIDLDALKEMVDAFLDQGFTYFDTAWFYHQEQSEVAIGQALVARHPRESFVLADKLPVALFHPENKSPEALREEMESYFSKQLEKTGAGYFDYYLLHSLDKEKFSIAKTYQAYEFIKEKKEKGLIKEIGFSFHDTSPVLEEILKAYPDVDFVQLQINYLDWNHESIQSKKNYQLVRKYGKKIIVMEPVKGGTLSRLPETMAQTLKERDPAASQASWALAFAASLDGVFMVLSGMSNMDQLKDNMARMENFTPLSQKDQDFLIEEGEKLKARKFIGCTECEYCLGKCPKHIPIPRYFTLYNWDHLGLGLDPKGRYKKTLQNQTPPDQCIACGACETICPQHLEIIDLLKKVDQYFDA